jgi:hypothetical protein
MANMTYNIIGKAAFHFLIKKVLGKYCIIAFLHF